MEEAFDKLTACSSSGTNWPYALVQMYEGPLHGPLPKDRHLGIQPQRGVGEAWAELSSIRSLKVWGMYKKPCHDIAYLLVWVENAMRDRHYGISIA